MTFRNFELLEQIDIKQILEGQDYLANKGIVHRDIKPDNILLRNVTDKIIDNEAVICDFGLATYMDVPSNELTLKKCGTPGYVAPEVQNANVDIAPLSI